MLLSLWASPQLPPDSGSSGFVYRPGRRQTSARRPTDESCCPCMRTSNFLTPDPAAPQPQCWEVSSFLDQQYAEISSFLDQQYGEISSFLDQQYAEISSFLDQQYGEISSLCCGLYVERQDVCRVAGVEEGGVQLCYFLASCLTSTCLRFFICKIGSFHGDEVSSYPAHSRCYACSLITATV